MKVLILPEVEEYLEDLGQVLYEKEYFGFEEEAIEYVEDLVYDIKKNLPILQHKPAPAYFHRFVTNIEQAENLEYAVFKKNRRTSWYVFFTTYENEQNGDDIFLVRYIGNNYTVAQHLPQSF
jgi:hypothetical protein